MIEVSDLLENFPDESGWRLINISRIFKYRSSYKISLEFQRFNKVKEYFNSGESGLLKQLPVDKTFVTSTNIANARLFPVGSIWFNNPEYQVILPNYFGRYSLRRNIINQDRLFREKITDYLNVKDIPNVMEGEQRRGAYSWIVGYEFERPLYHNKKKGGRVPLEVSPEFKGAHSSHFIAFYSAEVYRFFLTGFGITDVNERLIYPGSIETQDEIYSLCRKPTKEIQDKVKHKFPVFLKKASDKRSIETIGNMIYLPEFKKQMRRVQNAVNESNKGNFWAIDGLPITNYKRMNFAAKVVTNSAGKKGLLVMMIDSCIGYTDNSYKPIVPVKQKNSSGAGSSGGKGNRDNVETDDERPNYNDDNTTGVGEEEDINASGFESILAPQNEIEVEDDLYEYFDSGGNSVYFGDKPNLDELNPPGNNPDGSGKKGRATRKVTLFDYFEIFPEIVQRISGHENLLKKGLAAKARYFKISEEDFYYSNSATEILGAKIKAISSEKKSKFKLYALELSVNKTKTFYLFERVLINDKGEIVPSQSRTWLYANSEGSRISKEDFIHKIEILLKIRNTPKSLKVNSLVSKGFNHNHERKISVSDKEEKKDIPITKEEAISFHSNKISAEISKAFFKP